MRSKDRRLNFLDMLLAEGLKLKASHALYLSLFIGAFIAFFTFLAFSTDAHALSAIDTDPWKRFLNSSKAIYASFMLAPFIVLLVSGVIFIEQRANSKKYLYALPRTRGSYYFAKLVVIISLVFLAAVILILGELVVAYILNYRFPEYEFAYYNPGIWENAEIILHCIIAGLGVLGIQYFLSHLFKQFLIPIVIGIFGYVVGFILVAPNVSFAIYVPYAFPIMVKDFGMIRLSSFEIESYGWLNTVEIHSLICFFIFVIAGYLYEIKRNVE